MSVQSNMLSNLWQFSKQFLKIDIFFSFLLLLVYVGLWIVARGFFPDSEELVSRFAQIYQQYGYELILAASFLEALVLINFFMPGQIVLALGAVFAAEGYTDLRVVILSASLGAILGYSLDYILGFFGFAELIKKAGYGDLLNQAQKQFRKFGVKMLWIGMIHSNLGSFLSVVAGMSRIDGLLFTLIAVASTFFWYTFWGIIAYTLGSVVLVVFRKYLFALALFAIILMVGLNFWRQYQKNKAH